MTRHFAVALLVAVAATAHAELDVSHHRAVYKEINANLDSYKKVTARVTGESGPIALTGWLEEGVLRKIVATPGNGGSGVDEYYLEDGLPLFVFGTSKTEKTGKNVEERLYFADGKIAEWLTTDKSFVPHGEDYASLTEHLNASAATFVAALAPLPPPETTTGTFTGIEQGDYAYWNMRTADGEEASFFILKMNDALRRVLDNPKKFEGRKCRVNWKSTVEYLESAGGRMKVDTITDVEWL